MTARERVPSLGIVGSLAAFAAIGALLAAATRLTRSLSAEFSEPILAWFVSAGALVFVPLLLLGALVLWNERPTRSRLRERLRLRALGPDGWRWCGLGLGLIAGASVAILVVLRVVFGDVELHPEFMRIEPLALDRAWILVAWLPFFVLNIVAEELVWRGVLLPRQEVTFGRWAWLVNGLGWQLVHISFPWAVQATLLPTTLVLPFVAQRTGNTTPGLILHAALNGPGFIALALGWI